MSWQDILRKERFPWRILFVCTGNVMRSPYAEFLARDYLEKRLPGAKIEFRSGGAFHQNSRIHDLTVNILVQEGFEKKTIMRHKPRLWTNFPGWFAASTILIGMEEVHVSALRQSFKDRTFFLSEVAGEGIFDVPDPYTHPNKEEIYERIKDLTIKFVERIIYLVGERSRPP